jgi:hypothetical protein
MSTGSSAALWMRNLPPLGSSPSFSSSADVVSFFSSVTAHARTHAWPNGLRNKRHNHTLRHTHREGHTGRRGQTHGLAHTPAETPACCATNAPVITIFSPALNICDDGDTRYSDTCKRCGGATPLKDAERPQRATGAQTHLVGLHLECDLDLGRRRVFYRERCTSLACFRHCTHTRVQQHVTAARSRTIPASPRPRRTTTAARPRCSVHGSTLPTEHVTYSACCHIAAPATAHTQSSQQGTVAQSQCDCN